MFSVGLQTLARATEFREEHDLLGYRKIPSEAYWGVHTLRALENFQITGQPISQYPDLVVSLACIKEAAALANCELGLLSADKKDAIVAACKEIRDGKLHDQFVCDVIQGGAGTSTNMNANEVIANRALEIMGHKKGEYKYCHPNEDVNMSQSTNDVYPTSIKLALHFLIDKLLVSLENLGLSFKQKSEEFASILKMGRTQLQDAVPMTLGQEFSTYHFMVAEDQIRLKEARNLVDEINMGATAIGTGINTCPEYAPLVCRYLSDVTGFKLSLAANLIEATQDMGAFVQLSGVLKRVATKLSKTCNDLRLLSSGPRAGFGEIRLPPMAAGSSIMPGKVNPVIPEVLNQVAFEIFGNDVTITFAAEAGQLQLNAFEPIIGHSLFKSLIHLANAVDTLNIRCVQGIAANENRLRHIMDTSLGMVTALSPFIGYEASTNLALEGLKSDKKIYDLVLEKGLLPKEKLDEILVAEHLTTPCLKREKVTHAII